MLTSQHTYIALLVVQALHLLHHRLTKRHIEGLMYEDEFDQKIKPLLTPHDEHRDAHLATIKKLFQSVTAIRELSNGYAFERPNESDLLRLAPEFVTLERLCCPFFGFSIEVESEGGAVSLNLTGRDGLKPFITTEIGEHLPASLSDLD